MAAARSWIRGRLLGAGAFGSVNLAINREDGDVFAVKSVVVNPGSQVAVRAIENEISVLQALDSRYVVRCLGSDWTEESGHSMRNVFLEYMPEGCLTDFVKQFARCGALDEHLLRTYTRSIVEGIEYLHSRGIVHCDIKGKNILVGNGSVKLTDFGSAKRVEMQAEVGDAVNCAAKVNGTPLWMAPEVVRQVEQGPASDIWSLGCTVVEMATGRAPWSNLAGMNHFVALYHIGCTDELPAAPAWLSADAQDFLSHCLERDPRRRWTSAQLLEHPFLTTRFVAAPIALKAPASPMSVMGFPGECESELSACFVNSVPILAAPSLFKRGLVSAQAKVEEQVEEDWWSSPGSPDSGPWIVVRSPKNSSSPPSLEIGPCEAACINDESKNIHNGSVFFSWEQCSCRIKSELAMMECSVEGSVRLSVVGICTEDDDFATRIGQDEVGQRCELGSEDCVGLVDGARLERNDESGVVMVDKDASTAAEGDCDIARRPLVTTSAIEHGRPRLLKPWMWSGAVPPVQFYNFGISGLEISGCSGVTVRRALFLWLSSDGADGHECMQWVGDGWGGSNVDMSVDMETDVPWNYCTGLLRSHINLLEKTLTIPSVPCAHGCLKFESCLYVESCPNWLGEHSFVGTATM